MYMICLESGRSYWKWRNDSHCAQSKKKKMMMMMMMTEASIRSYDDQSDECTIPVLAFSDPPGASVHFKYFKAELHYTPVKYWIVSLDKGR